MYYLPIKKALLLSHGNVKDVTTQIMSHQKEYELNADDKVFVSFDMTNRIRNKHGYLRVWVTTKAGSYNAKCGSLYDLTGDITGMTTPSYRLIRGGNGGSQSDTCDVYFSTDMIGEYGIMLTNFEGYMTRVHLESYDDYGSMQATTSMSDKNLDNSPVITSTFTLQDTDVYHGIEVYQDDVLIGSYETHEQLTGKKTITDTLNTLNAINTNDITIRSFYYVKNFCNEKVNSGYAGGVYKSNYVVTGLSQNSPTVSNLTVSHTNIDEDITVSFDSSYSESKNIYFTQNNEVKYSFSTTGNSFTIPKGGIIDGTYNITVEALHRNEKVNIEGSYTFTKVLPIIDGLEPSDVLQDTEKDIIVSWVTRNQQSYTLQIDGITYSGTTAKTLTIPGNTLSTGQKTMTLTIYYTSSWGQLRTDTRTVRFIAYGKPQIPRFDGTVYYSEQQPTFTWNKDDSQVSYHFVILKGGATIIDTNDVTSTDNFYKCTSELENNTEYVVKVAIKNQYGKKSEFATKTITTNFVIANVPTINVYKSNNAAVINLSCEYSTAFSSCEVWRKYENGDWIRIAYDLDNNYTYVDKYVGCGTYHYKARSVSTTGGRADSDTQSVEITVDNFHLLDIEDMNKDIELIGNPSVTVNEVQDIKTVRYDGSKAPILYRGETNYKTISLSFKVDKSVYDAFCKIVKSAKVLLYRDRRGEKIYCQLSGDIRKTYNKGDKYTVAFSLIEVPFLEENMYKGSGNSPVVFFNGKYMFNGAVTFSGEV